MPEFPYYPCKLTALTSDGHTFPVKTSICVFLDSMESSLSLEFNKMKCSSKPWAGSRTVEERFVLVFGTYVFGTGLYLKCSGLSMA